MQLHALHRVPILLLAGLGRGDNEMVIAGFCALGLQNGLALLIEQRAKLEQAGRVVGKAAHPDIAANAMSAREGAHNNKPVFVLVWHGALPSAAQPRREAP